MTVPLFMSSDGPFSQHGGGQPAESIGHDESLRNVVFGDQDGESVVIF